MDEITPLLIQAIVRQFMGEPKSQITGISEFDAPFLNAQVMMRLATDASFTGGLREALIALLRSPHAIDPSIRNTLADALERGASAETKAESGLHGWKLKIVGLGRGKGKQNNQGEQVRTRRRWGEVGEFMQVQMDAENDRHGAREAAIKAAMDAFAVSREFAEKAHKYYDDREKWIASKRRLEDQTYQDLTHAIMSLEADRLDYDLLHVRGPKALKRRLEQIEEIRGKSPNTSA